MSRARLVHVFKNWKLLFENICRNPCGWKSALKCVKCCLKTENGCLKTQTKHPQASQQFDFLKRLNFNFSQEKNFEIFPRPNFQSSLYHIQMWSLSLSIVFCEKKFPWAITIIHIRCPTFVHFRGRSKHIFAQWRLQLPRSGKLKFELMTHSIEVC